MSKIKSIRRGESLPFVFDRAGEDITGFVCTITVKQFPADASSITRVIEPTVDTDGNSVWSGFLTSTETSGLEVGNWNINALLVNDTDDQEEAIPVRFKVTVPWA